jgi:uncharacterized membrane protein
MEMPQETIDRDAVDHFRIAEAQRLSRILGVPVKPWEVTVVLIVGVVAVLLGVYLVLVREDAVSNALGWVCMVCAPFCSYKTLTNRR